MIEYTNVAGEVIKVTPFEDLPEQTRTEMAETASWKVDGTAGDWRNIVDPQYGTIQHVVVEEKGTNPYDKVNILWSPGVYVVPVRINPDKKAEFLILEQRRELLRDKNGIQGNTVVDNIPQGLIRVWDNETPAQAAIRETIEETGHTPTGLAFLGNVGLGIANSETLQPFFLALVPYEQEALDRNLEETERIEKNQWLTWRKLHERNLIDGITTIGLFRSQRVLRPDLLSF